MMGLYFTTFMFSSPVFGYVSYNFLSNYMLVGHDAVSYYAEAHLSTGNAFVHTAIMPFSIYGLSLLVPSILNLNSFGACRLIYSAYFFFGGHYFCFSPVGSLAYMLIYYYVARAAASLYIKDYGRLYYIKRGLMFSVGGLAAQEVFGHMLFGDISSRFIAIPNAILYAMYFSSNHFLEN